MTTYDPFAALEALAGSALTQNESPPAPITNDFPSADQITLVTLNFFDNGPRQTSRFDSSQFAMNTQLFTMTRPFTPRKDDVAFSGSVQLHDPDYFDRHMHQMREDYPDKLTEERVKRYLEFIGETVRMPKNEHGPLVGLFVTKGNGTKYHFEALMRVSWNSVGNLKCEMLIEDRTITIIDFSSVTPEPGKKLPVLRGRFDPNNLWISRNKKGRGP